MWDFINLDLERFIRFSEKFVSVMSISSDAAIAAFPISDTLRQIKPGLIADKSGRHLKK